MPAVITIGLSPEIRLGPLTLAWHGLMSAAGIFAGAALAAHLARRRGLDPDPVYTLTAIVAAAGIVGSKLMYLLVNAPADLLAPAAWLSSRGFAFYGALILAPPAVALWLRRSRLPFAYLDLAAVGFGLGMAVGRVGDLISGEHHGPASGALWAIAYSDPRAEVPRTGVGYQSGALYEILLGLAILAVAWPLRDRLRRPGQLLALVIGLYGLGRFAMFFVRSDSAQVALGLNEAQLVSVGVLLAAALGWVVAHRRPVPADP